tara:strand:+ start:50 stop:496 length:447 start_codon:yes stop_codon:yes gene_type:complete
MNKILIVASEWYDEKIVFNLIKGATNFFNKNKINFDILYAPGSFEIPFIINKNINLYDGFVALGCIIRGETIHFELIAKECARKIMDLSIISKKPIGFGIITCENIKQAIKRSKFDSHGINKGQEAAYACAKLLYPEKLRHHNKDFIL